MKPSRMLAPLVSRSTFRRGVHLLLSGVILLPYVLLATGFVQMFTDPDTPVIPVAVLAAVTLAIGAIPPFLPAMRALEIAAARNLLDVALPEPEQNPPWETRWRAASWYGLHLVCGGGVMLALLVVAPIATMLVTRGLGSYEGWLTDVNLEPFDSLDGPVAVVIGLAMVPAVVYLVAIAGHILATIAPVLLEPSSVEQIRALEVETQRLTERNRLARELHDSVGHALTVTTVQAAAARQVLDSDPELARRALTAIEEAGRAAMDDLDHVLGLLREDGPARANPQRGLEDITSLVDEMRMAGLDVDAVVDVDPSRLPAATSREAYRIAQEGLTNALRHAGRVPVVLRVRADVAGVDIELTNPLDAGIPSSDDAALPGNAGPVGDTALADDAGPPGNAVSSRRRGLHGMRERVSVLGGELDAGRTGDAWVVRAHLPGAAEDWKRDD